MMLRGAPTDCHSLFPIVSSSSEAKDLDGVSLKNDTGGFMQSAKRAVGDAGHYKNKMRLWRNHTRYCRDAMLTCGEIPYNASH